MISVKQEGEFKYVEEGEGRVLLLLHGLFGALSNWKDVLDHFVPHYKVVIPMMPIYEMPILQLGVKGLANFIQDFIKYKGYDEVTLLGNSLGGHVALVYVANYPEKVHSMILTGSSGLYENAFGSSYPKRGDKDYIRKKVEATFYDPPTTTNSLVEKKYLISLTTGAK